MPALQHAGRRRCIVHGSHLPGEQGSSRAHRAICQQLRQLRAHRLHGLTLQRDGTARTHPRKGARIAKVIRRLRQHQMRQAVGSRTEHGACAAVRDHRIAMRQQGALIDEAMHVHMRAAAAASCMAAISRASKVAPTLIAPSANSFDSSVLTASTD